MEIKEKAPLADFTSWLIGGPADFFCLPETEAELEEALHFALKRKIPWTILGGGTNVLVSDQGVEGLVIGFRRFSALKVLETADRVSIECLSGTGKSDLLKIFLRYKLAPSLFLAGLPGDVGGGVVMNAGVGEALHPREFHEIVEWIEVLKVEGETLCRVIYQKEELQWHYRHSEGWQPGIVVKAQVGWEKKPDDSILPKVREANRTRLSKQPLDLPSCGSVFKNPPGQKAAQLIDSCGLKGFQIGGAQVSLKHANFIVNLGGATATEILQVVEHVQKTVLSEKNVALKNEFVRLGRF